MTLLLQHLPAALLLTAGVIFSILARKLTVPGAFTGFICGLLLYLAAGYPGILMLTVFFLCGTIATSRGRRKKVDLSAQLISGRGGEEVRRTAGQVFANAGMAAMLAALMMIFPAQHQVLLLGLTATLASAMADTLSSELGMIYGKNFYNCLSWKKDLCGLDGVVSFEGTLIGLAGAILIALLYGFSEGFNMNCLIIVIAGAAGNFSDSFLGATLERKQILTNDQVNFLSTLFAAVVGIVFFAIFSLL